MPVRIGDHPGLSRLGGFRTAETRSGYRLLIAIEDQVFDVSLAGLDPSH